MRGVALKELALLIVAVILLVILIAVFFLFQMPLLVFPTVLFDHLSTLIRGIIISGLWALLLPLIGVITALIWLDPSCWNPAGAIKCAVEEGVFIGILTGMIAYSMGIIPLAFFPVKLIGVDNTTFTNNFVNWIEDTNYMWNGGDSNPMWGKGPDPRISFVIGLKDNKEYNLTDALRKLKWPSVSFVNRIRKKVWEDNRVARNKDYTVEPFNMNFEIENNEINVTYNGEYCSQSFSLGNEFNVKCIGKTFHFFIDRSELGGDLYHVWVGEFDLRYKHIKNVVIRYCNNSEWYDYSIVENRVWEKFSEDLDIKGRTIFLDFYDAVPLGNPDYTDECGDIKACAANSGEPCDYVEAEEGVYICIPCQS